jgi:hypothetical protein
MKKNIFIKNNIQYENIKKGVSVYEQGFALFYVIIMISIISTIAFGLASITYKQKFLSSLSYDSQAAFYAADAGMECALFYNTAIFAQNGAINCYDIAPDNFGQFLTLTKGSTNTIWKSSIRKETCFSVELNVPTPPADPRPSFIAKGYNTCQQNQVRYIERTLRAYF